MPDDANRKSLGAQTSAVGGGDWRVIELASTGSTQAEAAARAAAGERGPLWIRADVQTAGRGRSGRGWKTPSGNFSATLLLAPGADAAVLPQLSLVAGVAAADVLNTYLGEGSSAPRAQLKWPNDVLIDGAKTVGILVETSIVGRDVVAFVGIGINLTVAPELPGRAVTRLADHTAATPAPSAVLERLAPAMQNWLAIWDRGRHFSAIRAAWLERSLPAGAPISVNAGDGPVQGTFEGLDMDGALLLCDLFGRRRRFSWGDVTLTPVKA